MTALPVVDQSAQGAIIESKGLGNTLLDMFDRAAPVQAVRFNYKNNTGAALAQNSIVRLTRVGPGLILPVILLHNTAFGTGRTLDIGLQEYVNAKTGQTIAPVINNIFNGLDVATATNKLYDKSTAAFAVPVAGLEVKGTTDVLAKVLGNTLPNNGEINGFLFMIQF